MTADNPTQTYIQGKDAPLEVSISLMQNKLQTLGFEIVEASWLNPVPNVWSVHIHDKNCRQLFTNGKGASREAALASALGEYFERLSTNYFFADYYLPEEKHGTGFVHYPRERWFSTERGALHQDLIADPQLRDFYDPNGELREHHLRDLNSSHHRKGVCALPYERHGDEKSIWFPVNLIANLYVSNGMSAGNTVAEARVQALSEILERYVKFKVIAEGISLPDIPTESIAKFPHIQQAIQTLEAAGYPLLIKDASLGGKYPVINVTLLNQKDASCFASFGAHPSFEVALERTVTELLQGRGLDSLNGFSSPNFDLSEVASPENLETHFIDSSGLLSWRFFTPEPDFNFSDWDFSATSGEEFDQLTALIEATGHQIYISDHEHLGVYSCRIIVPGMSEIYHPEDLVWDNSNSGINLRESLLNLPSLDKKQWQALLERIIEEGYDDQQPVASLLGLLCDSGSAWEDLRIGELKCHLALAAEDLQSAWSWCSWVIEFSDNAKQKHRYGCLQQWIGFELSEHFDVEQQKASLAQFYGQEQVEDIQQWCNGNIVFTGLGSPGLMLKGFPAHATLMEAYARLQAVK